MSDPTCVEKYEERREEEDDLSGKNGIDGLCYALYMFQCLLQPSNLLINSDEFVN